MCLGSFFHVVMPFVFLSEVTEIPDMKKVHSVLLLLATILRKCLLPHMVLGFDQENPAKYQL